MKTCWRNLVSLGLTTLLVLLAANPLGAQTRNAEALNWFKVALQEKDFQTKIVAYKKALALDSLFVEAWYNLGMAYKKQQDYGRAEQCLQRAYAVRSDKSAGELQAVIVYELATTQKKLGNLKEYEANLRQALALATEQKVKTRILLDLGRFLNEQGDYEKAAAALREGQKLDPDNQDFAKLMAAIESAAELRRLYESALGNIKNGKFAEAKALLEMIQVQAPAYKDVALRIGELDAQLKTENRKQTLALAYEQAQKQEAEGKLETAITSYENLLQQDGNYKDAQNRLAQTRQQLEQRQREEKDKQLESEYAVGAAALKKQDWPSAIISFKRILEAEPNFRDARRKLAEAQSGLSSESLDATVARFYEEGLAAMKRNSMEEARTALEKVRLLNPNYREVEKQLAAVAAAMPSAATEKLVNAPPAPAATSPLDSLYHSALALMVKEQWQPAWETLAKLQSLQPNYRDVAELQARTQTRLAQTRLPQTGQDTVVAAQAPNGKQHTVLILSCSFVLALLALYFLLAPTTRARLLLWRGKHKAAEQIYEKLLARDPQQTSLYPVLAELYLRAGRSDELAMRVYRRVLQHDLPERKRKAIRDFVVQNQAVEEQARAQALAENEEAASASTTDTF